MSEKKSLKERLAKKRQEIKARSESKGIVFLKEGTTRIRILPVPKEEDWGFEVVHFYLGNKIKGVFSPATLGKDCPIMEAYETFKADKKKQDVAKELTPKRKYVVPALVYEDDLGKKIDEARSGKLVLIPNGIYAQLIDFFLDPDNGDFTDPKEGYDLKIKRSGTGKTDTEYSVIPGKPSAIPAKWAKPVDLAKMVEAIIEPADEIEEKLETFLAELTTDDDDEDEDETPRKAKAKKVKRKSNG